MSPALTSASACSLEVIRVSHQSFLSNPAAFLAAPHGVIPEGPDTLSRNLDNTACQMRYLRSDKVVHHRCRIYSSGKRCASKNALWDVISLISAGLSMLSGYSGFVAHFRSSANAVLYMSGGNRAVETITQEPSSGAHRLLPSRLNLALVCDVTWRAEKLSSSAS